MARRKQPLNSLHNKFHQTISSSHRFRAEEGEGADTAPGFEGPQEEAGAGRGGYRRGGPRYSMRERQAINTASVAQEFSKNRDAAIRRAAEDRTMVQTHVRPGARRPEIEERRPRVTSGDIELAQRAERESHWKKRPGLYRTPPDKRKSVGSFVRDELPPSHQKWFEGQVRDPNSVFNEGIEPGKAKTGRYTSGQRRRQQVYTNALQEGVSHEEAIGRVRATRMKERVGRPTSVRARETRSGQAKEALGPSRPSGRTTKFQSMVPSPGEFKFGVDATTPSKLKLDELKQRFPNRSEQELLQIQQAGTELISQELLTNQKWAHETRRANLMGQKSGKPKETPDKITVFTTNVGHPAVSVPSDSLVGQYIIKKRKNVLSSYGVSNTQLRGKFPDMVRDQHIIDVAMGTSYGVQGRQGVMSNTGYRFSKRQSQGYGRPRPLGAQILYDPSTGRPLYDSQGNIRYSEGSTRPIDWSSPTFGARILIG